MRRRTRRPPPPRLRRGRAGALGAKADPTVLRGAAARLREAERLFSDFRELTPYSYRPFVRTFASFDEYERWKRAQRNPWYR